MKIDLIDYPSDHSNDFRHGKANVRKDWHLP